MATMELSHHEKWPIVFAAFSLVCGSVSLAENAPGSPSQQRKYRNELRVIENPKPLLADYPQFVEPVIEERRYEAPTLVNDDEADLDVRAWRFSFNARGIIEMPNRL